MGNIYKYFNDIEMDLNKISSIDVELDDITKTSIKKKLKSSITIKKHKRVAQTGVAAAVIVSLLLGSVIIPQNALATFADNIPVLNTLFQKFGSGYGGNFENYTQVIGEVKKDKGYEVRLDEVVMDDFSLKLIYTLKSPIKVSTLIGQKGNPFPHIPDKSIKINGEEFVGGLGGTDRIIDDYTVQVIEDFDIEKLNISKKIDIEINFKSINNIDGDWKFSFNTSKEKIAKDIKTFEPNNILKIKNVDGKEVKLKFEKVSFSPISTAIKIKANHEFEYNNLIFKDNNGNILTPRSASLSSNNVLFGYRGLYKFESLETIPDKIIVEYRNAHTTSSDGVELIIK